MDFGLVKTFALLPRPVHTTRHESFGYRSGVKFESVVTWDLNIISTDTRSCMQLDSHFFIDFVPESSSGYLAIGLQLTIGSGNGYLNTTSLHARQSANRIKSRAAMVILFQNAPSGKNHHELFQMIPALL
jgi:hypothetical protein